MKSLLSLFFFTLCTLSSVVYCKPLTMKAMTQYFRPILQSTLTATLLAASVAVNPIVSHAAIGEGEIY